MISIKHLSVLKVILPYMYHIHYNNKYQIVQRLLVSSNLDIRSYYVWLEEGLVREATAQTTQ